METPRVLRTLSRRLGEAIAMPSQAAFPAGTTWNGHKPPKEGFDRFYCPEVKSVLYLPTDWHAYEYNQDAGEGVTSQHVLAGVEDIQEKGFFDTGVIFSLYQAPDSEMAGIVFEQLQLSILDDITTSFEGSAENDDNSTHNKSIHVKYVSDQPEAIIDNDIVAPAIKMIYVEDLFLKKKKNILFRIRFESPEKSYDSNRSIFESIKTGCYFLNDGKSRSGTAFLSL